MKQNLKDDILPRKSSGVFALVAVLALGVSAAAYDEVHQKVNAGEQDLIMVDRLNEVAHLQVLLAEISNGRLDAAKHELRAKLAVELAALQPLVVESSQEASTYARCVLTQLDRDQKLHPDYYLTSSTSTGRGKIKVVQSGRQVAASKLINQ